VEGVVRAREPVDGYVEVGRTGVPWAEKVSGIVRADGTFVVERVPAGPADAYLMMRSAQGAESVRRVEVNVPEGGTARVEFAWRDIHVTGRLLGPDGPIPNVSLSLRRPGGSYRMMQSDSIPLAKPSVPRYQAMTREDGYFEMLLDEPGNDYMAMVESPDRRLLQQRRGIVIPDAESHAVDIVFEGARVSGLVVDEESGEPIAEASVNVMTTGEGGPRGSAVVETSSDGRFQAYVLPGTLKLSVSKPSYVMDTRALDAGEGGVDLRIALRRGTVLRGRIVDQRGEGVDRADVSARSGGKQDGTVTNADGSFQLDRLDTGSYALLAGSDPAGYALVRDVAVPGPPLTIKLAPGGSLELRVSAGGKPVTRFYTQLDGVNGVPVGHLRPIGLPMGGSTRGRVPAGRLEIEVRSQGYKPHRLTVDVAAGTTVVRDVELEPAVVGSERP
jgi:hypothetical protein